MKDRYFELDGEFGLNLIPNSKMCEISLLKNFEKFPKSFEFAMFFQKAFVG